MLSLLKHLNLSDTVQQNAAALSRLVCANDCSAQDFERIRSAFVESAGQRRAHTDVEAASRRLVACLVHLAKRPGLGQEPGKESLAAAIERIAAAELSNLWLPRLRPAALERMPRAA